MTRKTLLLFVDGLPHWLLEKHRLFKTFQHSTSVQPGFGYSVNIFLEMFSGLTPDDLGILNKWNARPDWAAGRLRRDRTRILRRGLDLLTRRPQSLSRVVHKVYGRATRRGNLANIPFEYLPYFASSRSTADEMDRSSALGLAVLRHDLIRGSVWQRDQEVFRQASQLVRDGEGLFATFGSLDYTGHRWGPESARFLDHATVLSEWCEQLAESFADANPEGHEVIVCSDHGMTSVTRGVTLGLERTFGRPGYDRYLFFLDANMARFWVESPGLRAEILDFLEQRTDGVVLDDGRRAQYGITNKTFGDFIFVLNEGLIFWPGWYGGWFPRGMHGYLPETPSQQTVFLYLSDLAEPEAPTLPHRTKEVYSFLRRTMTVPES